MTHGKALRCYFGQSSSIYNKMFLSDNFDLSTVSQTNSFSFSIYIETARHPVESRHIWFTTCMFAGIQP